VTASAPEQVALVAEGESEPIKPLAGGATEARNRRAQITF
jgi:outer membrane protein OmpA-like peptidoglycan-associated protein